MNHNLIFCHFSTSSKFKADNSQHENYQLILLLNYSLDKIKSTLKQNLPFFTYFYADKFKSNTMNKRHLQSAIDTQEVARACHIKFWNLISYNPEAGEYANSNNATLNFSQTVLTGTSFCQICQYLSNFKNILSYRYLGYPAKL